MTTLPIGRPRVIDVALLEIGDDVMIEHPKDRGVITILRGIIAKRVDSGSTRYYMTAEGATLLAWEPGRKGKIKVTLFGRDDSPTETLFDDMDIIRKLAG